jgi:GntR family transcriptional regulator
MKFDDSKPIFLQIYDYIVDLVLSRTLNPGDAIPSIRQFSAEFRVNHITVNKAIQMLVEEGILEKKRGVGMFLKRDALSNVRALKTQQFLNNEWPSVIHKVQLLEVNTQVLIDALKNIKQGDSQ